MPTRQRFKSLWVDALHIHPSPGRGRVATRAGLTMLVALGVLDATGHLDFAAYATFGAFASVYAETEGHRRWRIQAAVGALLSAAVITGALVGISADRSWWAVPAAAIWASVAAAASDRFSWRPPGPLFLVFAFATCASIPSTTETVGWAALVSASAALLAVVLGVVERRALRPAPPPGPPLPGPPVHRRRLHMIRCGVVVLIAGSIATASGISHPYWAMVSAVVPLGVWGLRVQVVRGLHRVAGTVLGLGVAAGLLVLHLPTTVVVLLVAGLQAIGELLVARHYALALVAITPLALLVAELAVHHPIGPLLLARLIETLLGAVIGVAAAVITRDRTA